MLQIVTIKLSSVFFFKECLIIKKLPKIGPAILPHLQVQVPKVIPTEHRNTDNFYGEVRYNE